METFPEIGTDTIYFILFGLPIAKACNLRPNFFSKLSINETTPKGRPVSVCLLITFNPDFAIGFEENGLNL